MATNAQLEHLYNQLLSKPFLDAEESYMLRECAERLGRKLVWQHAMLNDMAGRTPDEPTPWRDGRASGHERMDRFWANLRADKRKRTQKRYRGRKNGYRRTTGR